jgi:hypothetical protein
MSASPAWVIALYLGAAVFVPLLVIAIVRFASVAIAFAVAATFSIGAMVGFFLSMMLAPVVFQHEDRLHAWNSIPLFIFVSAGAIGGAALALWILRRIAGDRPWRRR